VEAVALMLPAMRGVAAAHARGVVHRDLKPDNIFVCLERDGTVRDCKVLDFGVSKLTTTDSGTPVDITLTGNLVGTPAYMAPEQVRGSKQIDHRADVWALGVVLYEMLAGRPPFVSQVYSAVMVDIATVDPPPLSRFRPDVPRRIEQVVRRALARGVEDRFQDVPAFIQALEEAARAELHLSLGGPSEGLITQLATPRIAVPKPSAALAPGGARSPLSKLLAATAVVLAALGLWRWTATRPPNPRPTAVEQQRAQPAQQIQPTAQSGAPAASGVSGVSGVPLPAVRGEGTGEGPTPAKHAHRRSPGTSTPKPAPLASPSARAGKLSVDDF
jgi:serine/threonine-protein kinase